MDTWYGYREVWSAHPWLIPLAVLAVLVLIAAVIGTIAGGPLAVLFIPGLALLYIHHLIAKRQLD